MKSSRLLLASLLLLTWTAGCDDDSSSNGDDAMSDMTADAIDEDQPVNQVVTSGSRLKARWWEPTDGPAVFAGWYDSEKQIPCRFRRAMDGELRCLPEVDSRNAWSRGSGQLCGGDARGRRLGQSLSGNAVLSDEGVAVFCLSGWLISDCQVMAG